MLAEGEGELSTATPVADVRDRRHGLPNPADKDVEQGLYLAVTQTVVRKIFPTEEDLALLVHVREVDVNDTELANGDDDGWLAVVLANRLPRVRRRRRRRRCATWPAWSTSRASSTRCRRSRRTTTSSSSSGSQDWRFYYDQRARPPTDYVRAPACCRTSPLPYAAQARPRPRQRRRGSRPRRRPPRLVPALDGAGS